MRSASERKIIRMIREQYEHSLYTTLLEMDAVASGGKVIVDAGLEVKNKRTGEKFTVQSVQKDGDKVTVSLVPPDSITGPITSNAGATVVSPGQTSQIYSIEDFETKFEV